MEQRDDWKKAKFMETRDRETHRETEGYCTDRETKRHRWRQAKEIDAKTRRRDRWNGEMQ